MSVFVISVLVILVFIVIYQIARASEQASILKGNEQEQAIRTNKLMAWLMLAVFFLGMYGIYKCHVSLMDKMLPVSASDHGIKYDSMLKTTLIITGLVFFATQIALFYFIFKYKNVGKRNAFFYPHNNNLEIIWTVIPALTLVILVVIGLRNWITMTSDAPKNAQIVEITGKQFNWIIRYPGADKVFGKTDFRKINDANNVLGLDWNDPASKDDIVVQNGEMRIIKDRPVKLIIRSRDVIHDVGLPHFRMKMDAVPGIITTMWFTPLYTTSEMATMTNDPEFVYEISCDQMCGKGHYAMRGTIIVENSGDFDKWYKEQKTYYVEAHPPAAPAVPTADSVNTTTDSVKTTTDSTTKNVAVK